MVREIRWTRELEQPPSGGAANRGRQDQEDKVSFDYQPVLKGPLVELRPLRHEDYADLYAVAAGHFSAASCASNSSGPTKLATPK